MRLDAALVARQLARSRAQASQFIRDGRVQVGGRLISKPATPVDEDSAITVTPDSSDLDLASRAGQKLAAALDLLAADRPEHSAAVATAITDSRGCLDIGASTGGFTDVLLRRGAQRVIALDVGHDQLRPALRADPRVAVVERTNIRDVDRARLRQLTGIEEPPGFVVGDLSFISLTLVVPVVADLLDPGDLALLLVKPQFEVGRAQLAKDGVVKSAALQTQAVQRVVAAAEAVGLQKLAELPSPLRGTTGNQEFFVLFQRV